jgi:4-amino-4-deoxy-L-arabinose transferase-like glycosyltransferase
VLQQLRSWLTAHASGIILALLAAGVALRTLLVVASPTPLGYVWDVYADGVRVLVTERRLPVADDCWQCYHPPLFYLLGSPLFALGQLFDAPGSDVWAHRLTAGLSLPAAGVVSYYGFRLLRLFGCRGASLVAGLALLLITPALFISSYGAEADIVMTALLAAFIYYLTVYAAHPSTATRFDVLRIGLLAGLAAATKYSGLVAIATAGIVFGLQLMRGPARARTVRHGLIVLAVCVLAGGWKYWDNIERYGRLLHANGSAAEGLSVGARAAGAPYEFTTMRLVEVRELFGLASPRGALTMFPVYQSVPTTLHALTWSDMSLFSRRTRHGLSTDPYRYKRIPIALVMTVIVLGFVPEALAIIGVVVTWRRRAFLPVAVFGGVTCAAYLWWLLPQSEWALKSKYILCLLPPAVLYATVGQAWLTRRWPVAGTVSALLLVGLVVVAHVYLYGFAVGGL